MTYSSVQLRKYENKCVILVTYVCMHVFKTGPAKTGLAGPIATSTYPQIQVSILDFVSQLSVADPGGG